MTEAMPMMEAMPMTEAMPMMEAMPTECIPWGWAHHEQYH
jgi:hypothetical protein